MPLYRRLPKRGFYNLFRVEYEVVNVGSLAKIESVDALDLAALRKHRLVRSLAKPVKILGDGTIERPLVVTANAFTKSAQEKINAAGGRCEIVAYQQSTKSKEKAA